MNLLVYRLTLFRPRTSGVYKQDRLICRFGYSPSETSGETLFKDFSRCDCKNRKKYSAGPIRPDSWISFNRLIQFEELLSAKRSLRISRMEKWAFHVKASLARWKKLEPKRYLSRTPWKSRAFLSPLFKAKAFLRKLSSFRIVYLAWNSGLFGAACFDS